MKGGRKEALMLCTLGNKAIEMRRTRDHRQRCLLVYALMMVALWLLMGVTCFPKSCPSYFESPTAPVGQREDFR